MTNITRRAAISMSGKALLALAASGPLTRLAWADESEAVSWERFLELCHEMSKAQLAENWNQDGYTKDVQRVIRRLALDDDKILEYIERYKNMNQDFPEIRGMYYEEQFMVSMLDFEPGEAIPLHDHPDMTGVTYCTTGSVEVEHFDKLEETAKNGNSLLQVERQLEMSAGSTAALTANRGNIHRLRANDFTRMIDVFTPPYNKDRVQRSRYYKMDSNNYQDRAGIFEAEESVDRI